MIGWLSSLSGKAAIASSNSGTVSPGDSQPRSPFSAAEDVSADTARATTVDTAEGDDFLGLFDLTTGTLAASLGAGADSAFAGGVAVTAGPGVIDGGPGADLFLDFGSNAGLTTKNFP